MKLTCRYQYFSYIILKHSSFFSWTSLIISANPSCHWVISDYPLIQIHWFRECVYSDQKFKISNYFSLCDFIKICVGVPNFVSITGRNIGHTICSLLECVSTTRLLFQVRAQVPTIGERWPRNRLHKLVAFNTDRFRVAKKYDVSDRWPCTTTWIENREASLVHVVSLCRRYIHTHTFAKTHVPTHRNLVVLVDHYPRSPVCIC